MVGILSLKNCPDDLPTSRLGQSRQDGQLYHDDTSEIARVPREYLAPKQARKVVLA